MKYKEDNNWPPITIINN